MTTLDDLKSRRNSRPGATRGAQPGHQARRSRNLEFRLIREVGTVMRAHMVKKRVDIVPADTTPMDFREVLKRAAARAGREVA